MGDKTQVVVIGGGPAGYPAAFRAADLGLNVTLIDERPRPGGVCLFCGCIPSKALLHNAKLIRETSEAEKMGLVFQPPEIDLDSMREWKDSVITRLTKGLGQLAAKRKINFIQGRASFAGPDKLMVTTPDGKKQELSLKNAIIATGSRPVVIPSLDMSSERMMDSTGALNLPDIPERLLVIGGGYIGLELGSVYAALGSRVSVVEMMPQLLPGCDKDLARPLLLRLKKQFENIWLESKVMGADETSGGIKVRMEQADGTAIEEEFSRVLVSVGRKPSSGYLGLENTGVKIDDHGFIITDEQCRTSEPTVFAVGDVAGQPMLAHKGTHEGLVAAEVIAGQKKAFEPLCIPAVVFTDPEIAWVGLTETEAKEKGIEYKLARFPWGASGRALTLERIEGVTKLLVDPETERILGAGITGVNAGDLIAECALAIEMGAVAADLAMTIHPHPTLSETIMEASESFYGKCVHQAGR